MFPHLLKHALKINHLHHHHNPTGVTREMRGEVWKYRGCAMNRAMENILRKCDYCGYSVIMCKVFPHRFPSLKRWVNKKI